MDNTLLLVDGSSFLYRAYHAMPDLRNAEGEPTGAIYGILNMLRKLKSDYPARYAACIFDARGKTFRDDLYPDYKANRASMPEDLSQQVAPIFAAVQAFGWPLLVQEGIEADDVIATLSLRATALGLKTIIATGDKDLAQLVNDQVILVNTMTRDGKSAEIMDRAGVEAKFGVPPEKIVDYLMLTGDAVDNVPGVDKVGAKTAVKLLTAYGDITGVMAAAPQIKGVVGENLRRAESFMPMARQLLTVKSDCDLSQVVPDWSSLAWRPQDNHALRATLARFGFRTLLRELQAQEGESAEGVAERDKVSGVSRIVQPEPRSSKPAPIEPKYHTVTTPAALAALLALINAAELTAFDTETDSLDPMKARLVGMSFAVEVGEGYYIPLAHQYADAPQQLPFDEVLSALRPWIERPDALKVGQNLKYDQHVLANHGVRLQGIAHDTLLQSYVLEAHLNHGLEALATRHLGRQTLSYEDVTGKGAKQISFAQVDVETATRYAAEDAEVTLHVHQTLWPRLLEHAPLRYVYESLEMPVARVLFEIERNGLLIDPELLRVQSHEIAKKLLELEQGAYELAGQPFNLASPKQIGEILFERLGLPVVKKTATGAASTDEEVLVKLAENFPLPKLLLEHRSLAKLKGTYTDKLPKMVNADTGRVHTNFAQAVAVTGRLASSDPNLQNIPVRTAEGRRIRESFVASPGCVILSADYSQIELRIMAHLSQDPGLCRAFALGQDVHRSTAAEIFGVAVDAVTSEQRRYAKVINFGLIYGMGTFGLAQNLGIDRKAAASYIERYFERYPGVARYMETTRLRAREQGYVETLTGRRLWLSEINSPSSPRRQAAERAAINAPMQGTAADLIKLAMIEVSQQLRVRQSQAKLVLQVHDELVLEVPDSELASLRAWLPGAMENVMTLSVPLLVELGHGANWEQAH